MRRLTIKMKDLLSPAGDQEAGAVTALTAVMMVVLLLMAAMVINTGMAYSEKAQLQNGADAAALAAADCTSRTACTQAQAQAIAANLANMNSNDNASNVNTLDFSVPGQVTATTSTLSNGQPFLALPFAGITKVSEGRVGATATAVWSSGVPVTGPSILPLTFGTCQVFLGATDTPVVLHGKDKCNAWNPASGLNAPGGFGYLQADANCHLTLSVDQWAKTDSGNGVSGACKAKVFTSTLVGQTVLVPIFGDVRGTGNNVEYKIIGWGAFVVYGWSFPPGPNKTVGKWTGSGDGIQGKFIKILSYEEGFTYGQPKPGDPDFGTTAPPLVKLIK